MELWDKSDLVCRYHNGGSQLSKTFASSSFEGQIGSILKKKPGKDKPGGSSVSTEKENTDAVSELLAETLFGIPAAALLLQAF